LRSRSAMRDKFVETSKLYVFYLPQLKKKKMKQANSFLQKKKRYSLVIVLVKGLILSFLCYSL